MRRSLIALAVLAPLAAGAAQPDLASRVDAVAASIIDIRHHIHAHPELSNREEDTAALIAEHLRSLGMEVRTGIAHTGVVGLLEGGEPGPVVAIRADMDALPVKERTDFAFKSTATTTYQGQKVPVAHACGHDIHVSVGLGVASVLADMREQLAGTVKFVFQPAEEGAPPGERGGAELMVDEGVLESPRPSAMFALHTDPRLEVGKIGWVSGPMWAASDRFRVTLTGKQAHGARPHDAVDPVVLAAEAIQSLQTIRSRNVHPRRAAVLSVGVVRGGERFNIIPEKVTLKGTVRTYDEDVQALIQRRMDEILSGLTRAAGGDYELSYEKLTPATINDPVLAQWARGALERAAGEAQVLELEPTMTAEDFAYFARRIPGHYFRLGVVAPGTTSGGLHTPTFRADDSAIPVGIRAMSRLVIDYLSSGGPTDRET